MPGVKIQVDDDVKKAAAGLRLAGNTTLRRRVTKALTAVAAPLGNYVAVKAASEMPQAGGLAYYLAAAKPTTKANTQAGAIIAVSLSLATAKGYNLPAANRGTIRHPVFGDTQNWVAQSVPDGAYDRALQDGVGDVRDALIAALALVAADVAASTK